MYCPDCGTHASIDQKFCRGCGASLVAVSQPQPVAGLAPYGETKPRGEAPDERQKYARLGFILFWGGILLAALLGILGDAVGTWSWRLGHFIERLWGLGGLVLLAGLGFMIYSRFFPSARQLEPVKPNAISPAPGSLYQSGQQSGPSFESREPRPSHSVTEHTTYSLDQQRPGSHSRGN